MPETKTTPIDTTRLRALAEATTPGPARAVSHDFTTVEEAAGAWALAIMNRPGTTTHCVLFEVNGEVRAFTGNGPKAEANAALIAACSRDTILALLDEVERLRARVEPKVVAFPLSEWSIEMGDVLWWKLPVNEPPWSGAPTDSDWPGYHTHWTHPVVPTHRFVPPSGAPDDGGDMIPLCDDEPEEGGTR